MIKSIWTYIYQIHTNQSKDNLISFHFIYTYIVYGSCGNIKHNKYNMIKERSDRIYEIDVKAYLLGNYEAYFGWASGIERINNKEFTLLCRNKRL